MSSCNDADTPSCGPVSLQGAVREEERRGRGGEGGEEEGWRMKEKENGKVW